MRAESTAATAQAMECFRIRSASSSRRSAGSSLESRRPRMRCAGSSFRYRITAAATTGPNSDPRPTSSTPATSVAPAAQARFSNLSVQRSFFSSRNLAAEGERPAAFRFFGVELDLNTEADQHLRRRRRAMQEQKLDESVEAGLHRAWTGQSPRPHSKSKRRLLLFDFLQPRRLALEPAQVIKLGAAHFRRAHHIDLIDDFGVERKDTLHALAETDLAYRKARLRAALPRNDHAFKRLQALFFAFSDLDQHLDRVARAKLREVGAAGFRQQFFDNRIAHKRFLPNSFR